MEVVEVADKEEIEILIKRNGLDPTLSKKEEDITRRVEPEMP